ncbi:uncharacterized protein LOC122511122 [Leptopilina heterotoma]|uniref:uncharacterized protein LOC122511122 n=1 Tax=Leptopilina heterotoma TaxID=63436 RepID=UPI001CA88E14|nr:uncharacterized protein LOC122511122 [Leptopilina heterotoma]
MRNKFCFVLFFLYSILHQEVSSSIIKACFRDLDKIYYSGHYYNPDTDECVKFFQHYFKINKKYENEEKCLQNRDPDYFYRLQDTYQSDYYYDKTTGECSELFYSQFLHTPKNSFSSKKLCEITCL